MPRIFDNIDQPLLPALLETLRLSHRADFCVGYFNLLGWKQLDEHIERFAGGDGKACRLLVGMRPTPQASQFADPDPAAIDNTTANARKKALAAEFRAQLATGTPSNANEAALRRLARQIRTRKLTVKLHTRHPLHAKLYLLHRPDPINPKTAYLGSSNLTRAGLLQQGELNVDVMDHDACTKLEHWFEARWNDRWCIDISAELAALIEQSWAREQPVPPFHVYLKIAWHLSREARSGQSEFPIPAPFGDELFAFQKTAVQLAARHLHRRGGVIIGDVVGVGKTIMASALLKITEETHGRSLIICPKNLTDMWEDYVETYHLHAKVISLSRVDKQLPQLQRYRTLLLDESHNLRNPQGVRYKAIADYISANDSRCILLSATPYNKTYADLSSQLRLFLDDNKDIGIRPEHLIRTMGEVEFARKHQCQPRSILAFEKSEHIEDWRNLMRMFMVRRTRSFLIKHYAATENGRKYIPFADGKKFYIPTRVPRALHFKIDDNDPKDPYARAYAPQTLDILEQLALPRYGLAEYLQSPLPPHGKEEAAIITNLSRAGNRLIGFCRTGLFKRLESGGPAFLQSIQRHIIRNHIFLHAIQHDLPIPIGYQSLPRNADQADDEDPDAESLPNTPPAADDLPTRAADIYAAYDRKSRRLQWINPRLFTPDLQKHLTEDNSALQQILTTCGEWDETRDAKLQSLTQFLHENKGKKVLIFTEFADTARYLQQALQKHAIPAAAVTGATENLTRQIWRFSPQTETQKQFAQQHGEINTLISTDVLSEGQNLQQCSIIVNFDLPWAIIRLIQRVGRVDRIGQQSPVIHCCSFFPADGVERIINLRARVLQRLKENREVVGSDEIFFPGDKRSNPIQDIYTEKSGILDGGGEDEGEVDLASYAWQIWKNATDKDPSLPPIIENLPDLVFATKSLRPTPVAKYGALKGVSTPPPPPPALRLNLKAPSSMSAPPRMTMPSPA